jgi:hypothetical protein
MAWLKVAVRTLLGQTPVARFAGATEITVGGAHCVALVVKVQTKFAANPTSNRFVAAFVMVAV